MNSLLKHKLVLFLACFFGLTIISNALTMKTSKKIELQCEPMAIVLSNGRILKDYIAASEDGQLFIPYEVVADIMKEQIYWDEVHHTLKVGSPPTATVMSDKIKVYHYDYDTIRSYLYCPDAKANKNMTMANEPYSVGYYFTNIFSASFNLNKNYHSITAFLGCEDFKSSDGQVDFYVDDTLIASYTLKADDLPKQVSLDVSGGNQLKIKFSHFKPDTQINLADVYIC